MELIKLSPISSEALKITDEFFNELEKKYGKGNIENFRKENSKLFYFAAIKEVENIIACGALNHIDETTVEIKRMYVKPAYRGKGISKILLKNLENEASKNYRRIILETGIKQPEAIGLYKKWGYKGIDCYGRFAKDAESVCFEKHI